MQNIKSYVKNSYELVHLLEKLTSLPQQAVLLVADIDNLYPSLPIQATKQRVNSRLNLGDAIPRLASSPEHLISLLLEIQLENNCFTFNQKFYKQIKGIPMGKAWAPAVASIYLEQWESKILTDSQIVPLLYVRYIDDIFMVLNSRSDADVLIQFMQSADPHIKLSELTIASTVHFLDLNITIDGPRLTYSLYSKPSHLKVLIDFQSSHSFQLKRNVVLSQLIRTYRLHSDLQLAGESMYIFIQLMVKIRHLTCPTARKIWKNFIIWLTKQCQPTLGQAKSYENQRPLTLLVHNNSFSNPFKRIIGQFCDTLAISDQEKLQKILIKERAGLALGRSLFLR
jgi:hypothetical protein